MSALNLLTLTTMTHLEHTDKPIDICTIVYVMTKLKDRLTALEYAWHEAVERSEEDRMSVEHAMGVVQAIYDELYDDIWRIAHGEVREPLEAEPDEVFEG